MFAKERQNEIVKMVNKTGSVKVKELSEIYQVTEDSIRKDLTLLEKRGLLHKTYGGAIKNRVNIHDLDVSQRRAKNIKEKQKIAQKALEYINNGDMIFLDISTANLELAKLLAKSLLNITVVTNMIDIMLELAIPCTVKVIFIGGSFGSGRDGFVGSLAISQITHFRFDTAFIGVVGIDLYDNSVTTYMAEDGLTKKAVMDSSRKKYMMLETIKFDMDGTYKYAKVDEFTGAIMDKEPDEAVREPLKDYHIEWIF